MTSQGERGESNPTETRKNVRPFLSSLSKGELEQGSDSFIALCSGLSGI
jgi:hypothetical protein